jgi:hypothetical protein
VPVEAAPLDALDLPREKGPSASFTPGPTGQNVNATFGTISSAFDARSLQLGLKLLW